MQQRCKNCEYYSAYYKQWSSGFERLNKGECSKHKREQRQNELCEDFKSNEKKERKRDMLRLFTLSQAINAINDIAQILKEKHQIEE